METKSKREKGKKNTTASFMMVLGCFKIALTLFIALFHIDVGFAVSTDMAKDAKSEKHDNVQQDSNKNINETSPTANIHPEVLKILKAQARSIEHKQVAEDKKQDRAGLLNKQLDESLKKMDGKIAELQRIKDSLSGAISQSKEKEAESLQHLIGVYSAMEPDKAANLLERIDEITVIKIFSNMKSKKVAAIMAQMEPSKAARISSELSSRKITPPAE